MKNYISIQLNNKELDKLCEARLIDIDKIEPELAMVDCDLDLYIFGPKEGEYMGEILLTETKPLNPTTVYPDGVDLWASRNVNYDKEKFEKERFEYLEDDSLYFFEAFPFPNKETWEEYARINFRFIFKELNWKWDDFISRMHRIELDV